MVEITVTVNGEVRTGSPEARMTLAAVLRDELDLVRFPGRGLRNP